MNILSWKAEYFISEEGSQTKASKEPYLTRTALLPQVSHKALETATWSPNALRIRPDKRDYCFSQLPQLNPQSSLYWRNIQVLLSLNRRRSWEWEEFCSPAHPSCFSIFLSTTATTHFWMSDRQLPKLDHLAFITRHNHKAPRTRARWKVKFSNICEQKHFYTKNLLFLGEA